MAFPLKNAKRNREKAEILKCSHIFYYHSPFLHFLGVFIFFNYSIGFTELEDPGASAPVSLEPREGRAWKNLVALAPLTEVFSHLCRRQLSTILMQWLRLCSFAKFIWIYNSSRMSNSSFFKHILCFPESIRPLKLTNELRYWLPWGKGNSWVNLLDSFVCS